MDNPQNPVSSWTESERRDLELLGADEIGRNTAVFRNVIETNSSGFAKGGIKFEGGDGETLIINIKKSSENERMDMGSGTHTLMDEPYDGPMGTIHTYPAKPMSDRGYSTSVSAPSYTATSNTYQVRHDDGSRVRAPYSIHSQYWGDFKEDLHEFINNLGVTKSISMQDRYKKVSDRKKLATTHQDNIDNKF